MGVGRCFQPCVSAEDCERCRELNVWIQGALGYHDLISGVKLEKCLRPTTFTLESSGLERNVRGTCVREYLSRGVHLSTRRLGGERFIVDGLASRTPFIGCSPPEQLIGNDGSLPPVSAFMRTAPNLGSDYTFGMGR